MSHSRTLAAIAAQRQGVTLRPMRRVLRDEDVSPTSAHHTEGAPSSSNNGPSPATNNSRPTAEGSDLLSVEAPLQIRLADDPWLTTMRTPGRDADLVLGLLYSEGLIRAAADVSTIAPCGRPGAPGYGDTINASPGAGFAFDPERLTAARRSSHAGCGVCGRQIIHDLLQLAHGQAPPRSTQLEAIPLQRVFQAQQALRQHQDDFRWTGGCHAAVALNVQGQLCAHAEDVGRHNALDKVLGQCLRQAAHDPRHGESRPRLADLIAVSGRASFELTHKAIMAGARVLCSVSAPSSLAVDLAAEAGLCLVGFVRAQQCNVYCHATHLQC